MPRAAVQPRKRSRAASASSQGSGAGSPSSGSHQVGDRRPSEPCEKASPSESRGADASVALWACSAMKGPPWIGNGHRGSILPEARKMRGGTRLPRRGSARSARPRTFASRGSLASKPLRERVGRRGFLAIHDAASKRFRLRVCARAPDGPLRRSSSSAPSLAPNACPTLASHACFAPVPPCCLADSPSSVPHRQACRPHGP